MTGKRSPRRRSWYAASAAAFRWLHIYLSMLGFASLMFFAFTGITLNHPAWLGGSKQSVRDSKGKVDKGLLGDPSQKRKVDKLEIAESLRSEQRLRGRVTEFRVDEFECMVVFKGPGYSADVFIDVETGAYTVTETSSSVMAVLNDLHKGRDSGVGWSWVIDVSAVLMMLISLSGFGLLFYIRRRRTTGLVTALIGTVVLFVAWAIWVP